jgi:hypothetical protein
VRGCEGSPASRVCWVPGSQLCFRPLFFHLTHTLTPHPIPRPRRPPPTHHTRPTHARERESLHIRSTHPMFALAPLTAPARAGAACRARPGAALIECAHKKGSGSVKNGRDSRSRVS